jgi:hypothetical protein
MQAKINKCKSLTTSWSEFNLCMKWKSFSNKVKYSNSTLVSCVMILGMIIMWTFWLNSMCEIFIVINMFKTDINWIYKSYNEHRVNMRWLISNHFWTDGRRMDSYIPPQTLFAGGIKKRYKLEIKNFVMNIKESDLKSIISY